MLLVFLSTLHSRILCLQLSVCGDVSHAYLTEPTRPWMGGK